VLYATTHYGDFGFGLVFYRNLKGICEEGIRMLQLSLTNSEEKNFTKKVQLIIFKAKL
jgi:hypothetical protein